LGGWSSERITYPNAINRKIPDAMAEKEMPASGYRKYGIEKSMIPPKENFAGGLSYLQQRKEQVLRGGYLA
jgi:hypothetical protein